MKQTSVYDFYVLGKALRPVEQWTPKTVEAHVAWEAQVAYEQLSLAVLPDSVLLPASKDAAKALLAQFERRFGQDIEAPHFAFLYAPDSVEVLDFKATAVQSSLQTFETVFRADLPRMTVFSAEQKGIYRTESLIDHAEDHFPEAIRKRLPEQARLDIHFAGKCLGFDIPTASAFHTWRALEVVFSAYYVSITGRTFEDNKVTRNWGKYIEALDKVGADKRLTANLDHIRSGYRNPVMHPSENVPEEEAFSLFGIGIGAMTQLMQAIETQPHADKALAQNL